MVTNQLCFLQAAIWSLRSNVHPPHLFMANGDDNAAGIDELTFLIGGLIIALLIGQAARNAPAILQEQFGGTADAASNYVTTFTSTELYTVLFVFALVFSAACLAGTVYAAIQHSYIRAAQKRELDVLTYAAISGETTENERWQEILSHAASDDEELWRLAIIEADVMLDEMLEAAGYPQDQLGEKLRSVERSDFQTIDQAWEAHKLRNVIAHEGSGYDLSRREAQKAIDNYRSVFKEFGYI